MSNQLTLPQVAKILKVSEKSIRRYIKSGRIKASLIRGSKGDEYRIDKSQIKLFQKPARGKLSHRASVKPKKAASQKRKAKPTKAKKSKAKNKDDFDFVFEPLEPIGKIARETIEKKIKLDREEDSVIDYKALYERLLARYEQSLITMGNMEAQLNSQIIHSANSSNKNLEERLSRQEDIILELYQDLKQQTQNEDLSY